MPDSYVFDHSLYRFLGFLTRTNQDPRSSYGYLEDDPRSRISDAWRFPIIDRHYEPDEDKPRRNLVTFVFYDGQFDHTVELLSTATGLDRKDPPRAGRGHALLQGQRFGAERSGAFLSVRCGWSDHPRPDQPTVTAAR